MSENSFSIGEGAENGELESLANLSQNVVVFDCDHGTPFMERVKLDGDEYATGSRRKDKSD